MGLVVLLLPMGGSRGPSCILRYAWKAAILSVLISCRCEGGHRPLHRMHWPLLPGVDVLDAVLAGRIYWHSRQRRPVVLIDLSCSLSDAYRTGTKSANISKCMGPFSNMHPCLSTVGFSI